MSGGKTPSYVSTIERFSFSSDGSSSGHGDLSSTRAELSGHQV